VFEALRPYCTETPTGSAAVDIEEVEDADRAYLATYCCKGFWWQRVRYVDQNRKPRIRKVRLSSRRHAEWLLWRGAQELNALTSLYGARREGKTLVRTS
jgi:hypothetical protein